MFMTDIIGFDSSAEVRDETLGERERKKEKKKRKNIYTHTYPMLNTTGVDGGE